LVKEVFSRLVLIKDKFLSILDENKCLVFKHDERIWNFFEWNDKMINAFGDNILPEGVSQIALPNLAFLKMALESYAFLADLMGVSAEEELLIAKQVAEMANKSFFDASKNCYVTYLENGKRGEHYSEYVQAMAIYSGIATGERKFKVAEQIVESRENKSQVEMARCSLSNLFYLYEALLSLGDRYVNYVKEDIKSTWGKMLLSGATSFYEVEEGADAFYYAGSLCHGWSAIPAYFYGKYKLAD
jgi:hypothetical protein